MSTECCISLNIQMAFQSLSKIHRLISLLSQAEYYITWKVLNKIDLCCSVKYSLH